MTFQRKSSSKEHLKRSAFMLLIILYFVMNASSEFDDSVELVGSLARLEIYVRILRRSAGNWRLGIEASAAERFKCVLVEQRSDCLLVHEFDLLDFVRSPETVEEVQERDTAFQRDDMRHSGKVHNLLYRRGGEHRESGLARGHDVLMVAENRQRLCRKSAGGNVEHTGQKLSCYLVHIGNHQQKTLRCSERGGQRSGLQRTVNGSGRSGFGLHLDNLDRFAENILAPDGSPLIDQLGHRGRRGNRVDCSHFAEHIGDMGRSIVTVAGNKFLLFHLNLRFITLK